MAGFVEELANFIERDVHGGANLVLAKICIEVTGLLPDAKAVPVLQEAMDGNNSWLQETAFRACRNLPRLQSELRATITRYVMDMPITQFLKSYRTLRFSLWLSDSLNNVLKAARWRHINLLASALAVPLTVLVAPIAILVALFYAWSLFVMFVGLDVMQTKGRGWIDGQLKRQRVSRAPVWIRVIRNTMRSPVHLFRAILALFLVMLATMLIRPELVAQDRQIPFWPWADARPAPYAATLIAVSLLLMNWQLLHSAWTTCAMILRGQVRLDRVLIASISITLPIITAGGWGALWLADLIERLGFVWIPALVILIVVNLVVCTTTIGILRGLREYLADRKRNQAILITNRMSRAEIVAAFDSLHTETWRLRFVRSLAAQKINVIGEWPGGFHLLVSASVAVTELARLEERWLKLDR